MTKRTLQSSLTIYRRHAGKCPNHGKKRVLQGCECPLWVHGKVRGKFIQKSLDTRKLGVAEDKRDALLRQPDDDPTPGGGIHLVGSPAGPMTIQDATTEYLAAKEGLADNSIKAYTRAVTHFRAFAEACGLTYLKEIRTSHLRDYFAEYGDEWLPTTAEGRLTDLRVWFNYCVQPSRRWIEFSPAAEPGLTQSSNGTSIKRQPFEAEEITQILAAIDRLPTELRDRGRALILLLLFTGMRISDATFFEREFLTPRNTADYYVIKSRKPIDIPPEVDQRAVDALQKLPRSRVYFFQPDRAGDYREARQALRHGVRGFGKLMPDYQARIDEASKLVTMVLSFAGIDGFVTSACHRFRDTFAVNMLVEGADIYTVSKMLGHSDVSITDGHYMKLVKGYRERKSQSTRVLAYSFPLVG